MTTVYFNASDFYNQPTSYSINIYSDTFCTN